MLTKGDHFEIQVVDMTFSRTLSGYRLIDVRNRKLNIGPKSKFTKRRIF
jgi:hypothetical protein